MFYNHRDTNLSKTILLSIPGMSCGGCVSLVETALQGQPGIEQVAVNLADKSASVTGDVEVACLIRSIAEAGFEATELPD